MKDFEVSLPAPCGETWDGMAGRGCNRHCATCDTVIHDLATMSIEDAERLIKEPGGACVRARISPDGTVALGKGNAARRMKAVVGGSLALAVAACQTTSVTPLFDLSGRIGGGQQIELLDARGLVKTTNADRRGNFAFRNLHAGRYSLRTYNSRNGCEGEEQNLVQGIELSTDDRDLGQVNALYDNCQVIIVGVMTPKAPSRSRG